MLKHREYLNLVSVIVLLHCLIIIVLGYVEHSGGEPSLSPITVKPDSND